MFGTGWKDAEATIVQRRLVSQTTSKGRYGQTLRAETYEYIADVRPGDGSEPFRAMVKEPFNAIHFHAPEVGQVVRVKYSPKESDQPKVKFDDSDPQTFDHLSARRDADKKAVRDAHSAEAEAAWDAALKGSPGSDTPSDSPLARERDPDQARLAEAERDILRELGVDE